MKPGCWPSKFNKHFLGLSFGAGAGLFYALGNSIVQYIYREHEDTQLSEFQIIFVRSLVTLILVGVLLAWKRINPTGGSWKNFGMLCLMGVAKISSIIFFYGSLAGLPLGDATVILFMAPVFTIFLGIILLKEQCSLCNIILGLLSFLGVAIIAAPGVFFPDANTVNPYRASHTLVPDKNATYTVLDDDSIDHKKIRSVGFGVGAAIALSFHFIILKVNTQSVDCRISLFYPSMLGIFIPPIAMAIQQEPVTRQGLSVKSWLLMISTGFTYFAAMMLLAYALLMEDAGPVALVRNAEVIFAFVFEIAIERQIPMMFSIIGVTLILWTTMTIFLNRIFNIEKKLYRSCCYCCCCLQGDNIDDDVDDNDSVENFGNENEKIPMKAGYKPIPKYNDG